MNDMSYPPDSVAALKSAPQALEAEQSVLSALLAYNDCHDLLAGTLAESDFYSGDHQAIYRAITALVDASKPADAISVSQWLKDRGQLEKVGGFDYVNQLAFSGTPVSRVRYYAEIVREKSVLRAILAVSMKMGDLVYATEGRTSRQLLDEAQSLLAAVDERSLRGAGTFRRLSDVLVELISDMDDAQKENAEPVGVKTGFHRLDMLLNPLSPGQLIVVGARPAVGKTSLAINIAMHVATHYTKPVAMFSMEMTDVELAVRILSGFTGMAAGRFREHRLGEADWDRVNTAIAKLSEANFLIDQTGGLSIQQLTARARVESKRVGGFGLLIVDYVQLSRSEGKYDGNRAVEIGAVTSGLKRLAKELNCPIMALSQLNREAAKEHKLPTIAELRDSGSIEADADTVLLLHRDYVMSQKPEQEFDALVIIGKQRNGQIGKVELDYEAKLTRFFNAGEAPGRGRTRSGPAYSAAKSGD